MEDDALPQIDLPDADICAPQLESEKAFATGVGDGILSTHAQDHEGLTSNKEVGRLDISLLSQPITSRVKIVETHNAPDPICSPLPLRMPVDDRDFDSFLSGPLVALESDDFNHEAVGVEAMELEGDDGWGSRHPGDRAMVCAMRRALSVSFTRSDSPWRGLMRKEDNSLKRNRPTNLRRRGSISGGCGLKFCTTLSESLWDDISLWLLRQGLSACVVADIVQLVAPALASFDRCLRRQTDMLDGNVILATTTQLADYLTKFGAEFVEYFTRQSHDYKRGGSSFGGLSVDAAPLRALLASAGLVYDRESESLKEGDLDHTGARALFGKLWAWEGDDDACSVTSSLSDSGSSCDGFESEPEDAGCGRGRKRSWSGAETKRGIEADAEAVKVLSAAMLSPVQLRRSQTHLSSLLEPLSLTSATRRHASKPCNEVLHAEMVRVGLLPKGSDARAVWDLSLDKLTDYGCSEFWTVPHRALGNRQVLFDAKFTGRIECRRNDKGTKRPMMQVMYTDGQTEWFDMLHLVDHFTGGKSEKQGIVRLLSPKEVEEAFAARRSSKRRKGQASQNAVDKSVQTLERAKKTREMHVMPPMTPMSMRGRVKNKQWENGDWVCE